MKYLYILSSNVLSHMDSLVSLPEIFLESPNKQREKEKVPSPSNSWEPSAHHPSPMSDTRSF